MVTPATPDAAGGGAVPLRVVKTKIIEEATHTDLENSLNAFYRDFDDVTGHSETAYLLSVETFEHGANIAAVITYTE